MKLKVLSTTFPTSDSVTLTFEKPNNDLTYHAGQHALLNFSLDGKSVSRTYSFSSSPVEDNHLAITVRSIKDGLVSNLLQTNSIEDIELEQIGGSFFITPDSDRKRHLIMLAAGSGITPIMSMIRTILKSEPQSVITLVYSNRSHDQIIFRDDLMKLSSNYSERLHVLHVLTQQQDYPADFPVYYKGRLSKLILKKTIKNIISQAPLESEFYLCGPSGFLQMAKESLQSLEINERSVHTEIFYSLETTDASVLNLPPREILLDLKNGEQLLQVKTGESILQAAFSKNVRLAHSCKQGQCGACRAILVSGEVKMRGNYVLTQGELNASQILLCQAYPLNDNVTVRPINQP